MSGPRKIISGGQTGADRAGLDFALARGIEHGGWCPRGRRAANSEPIPERYSLRETPSDGYKERTLWNVRDADATVVFNLAPGKSLSSGSALTVQACLAQHKPYLVVRSEYGPDAAARAALQLARFLVEHHPDTLNVAGNREQSIPGIGAFVRTVLAKTWDLLPSIEQAAAQTARKPREAQLGLRF